jgi:predicted acetyltransferase
MPGREIYEHASRRADPAEFARPSARERGHATAMLAAALPVARGLGIGHALVTCDDDNLASRKVIEANGGVLEDQRAVKLRYWADLLTSITGP